ncbi:MAG: ferrochelatase [Micrococcales bacterium]|nr:ferrochelatase [Micrococcales bacterium]
MDAVLLVSFGGPESPDEVMPFLRRVTAGRNVPEERLLSVAEHYYARGGVSPINAQNRELQQALSEELAGDGLTVHWGNRNSAPWLGDAFAEMATAGVDRAIAVFTSAYSSYSGCRQYRENLADALGDTDIQVLKIPAYFNHPGFVRANRDHLEATLRGAGEGAHVLFATHSIPVGMAASAGPGGGQYTRQHLALAEFLMSQMTQRLGRGHPWELVFQSRSGPPQVPWLEPDVNDRIEQLADAGVREVVVAPIGFVSDHMEVVQDLDTEAARTAQDRGVGFHRVPTVGADEQFVRGLADAVRAVRAGRAPDTAFDEPLPTPCLAGCCPNPRDPRPALCERVS